MTSRVLIGMGSNIKPEDHLKDAQRMLTEHWPGIRFSSTYRSAARDREKQDDFLNAVALVQTDEIPLEILELLRTIEKTLGKDPPYRFGPRTIDLDILLYDERMDDNPSLTLPHSRMHERRFVLEPLCELISATERHPRLGRSWGDLLSQTLDQRCERVES